MNEEKRSFRPEIQGLRAVAVMVVLTYHLWPALLPGGYTGVDVFFVISGYLITGLLLHELHTTGSISLARFYVRRARRLLPAALLTLLVIMGATVLLFPVTAWRRVAQEIFSATLYLENWWLAAQAVDYLAIESKASPVQHFWSLSVEEQYYFFWPALLLGLYALTKRIDGKINFRSVCILFLSLVGAISFAYSIWSGISGENAAYFSSFSRAWQLVAGGLLAVFGVPKGKARLTVLVIGLIGIFAASIFLNGDVAYPGYAALLPTCAALLAIHAGTAYQRSWWTRWLGYRPVQYIGDISYSLYLWHWPIIIFTKYYIGEHIGWLQGVAIGLAAIGLAALSKRFVEDVFRENAFRASLWKPLSIAITASLVCVTLAWGMMLHTSRDVSTEGTFPGASAIFRLAPTEATVGGFRPALANVGDDVPDAYAQDCIQGIRGTDVKTCIYGRSEARVRIAIVGDSHAVHWLPAFEEVARYSDIQVVGVTKTSCITADLPLYHRKLKGPYRTCQEWTRKVMAYLNAEHFDYIVLAQSPQHHVFGMEDEELGQNAAMLARSMETVWSSLKGARDKIVVFRSTPWQPTIVHECYAANPNALDHCTGEQAAVLGVDVMTLFARSAKYRFIDFSDLFCLHGKCPAVIGKVFVYRDAHHITATYMRTMAPMVAKRMGLPGAAAVAQGQARQSSNAARLSHLSPNPSVAKDDRGQAFADHCVQSLKRDAVVSCKYGDPHGNRRIAIVGDAMGANLLPGLAAAASRNGWRLETFFKDSCLFSARPVYNRHLKRTFEECSRWNTAVLRRLQASRPDLVLLTQSPNYVDRHGESYEQATPRLQRGISKYVATLDAMGSEIAVLRYLPWLPFDVPNCLMRKGDAEQCTASRLRSMRGGPLLMLAKHSSKVVVLDVSDAFCGQDRCEPIRDGILVYRDSTQPTATFARTLGDELSAQLVPMLSKSQNDPMASAQIH